MVDILVIWVIRLSEWGPRQGDRLAKKLDRFDALCRAKARKIYNA